MKDIYGEPDYASPGFQAFWDIVCWCAHGRACPVTMEVLSRQPQGKVYTKK